MTPLTTTPIVTGTAGDASAVTVVPSTLDTLARTESDVAAAVSTVAASEEITLVALHPTFGVIGTDFLSATEFALATRQERLTQIASSHSAVAERTTRAQGAYRAVDAGAAAGVDSTDRELTL